MNDPVPAIYEQELRLLLALALNGFVILSSYRFARRMSDGDWLDRGVDTLLLLYVIQYVVVGVLGVAGLLNIAAIVVLTALTCAAAWLPYKVSPVTVGAASLWNKLSVWGCGAFGLAFLSAAIVNQHVLPPLTTDGLTYHLPATAQWLQTGRLGLYETWLFNPANTYSPLGGSIFMAWLIAPLGHDAFARCAQAPALILLFLCAIQITRGMGANLIPASLIATALALSQPFIIQALIAKDDLYLAAFILVAVSANLPERLADRGGALRLGCAIGLCLSIKFTAVLALPMVLLGIDAPWRAGWRAGRYVSAIAVAIVLAGPWYLRNAILTGNPVFPVNLPGLSGILTTERSLALRSVDTIWRVITENYYGVPGTVAIALAVLWSVAAVVNFRRLNEPMVRICLLGPVLGFLLFLWKAPYGEVRFLLPTIAIMFVSASLLLTRLGRSTIGVIVGLALAVLSIVTAFQEERHFPFIQAGIVAAIATLALVLVEHTNWIPRRPLIAACALLLSLTLVLLIYVDWNGYVSDIRANAINAWHNEYPDAASAWELVRDRLPPGQTVAYAGTHLTYPLMGFDLQQRVVYAPVRPGVQAISDLPPLENSLPGEKIDSAVAAITTADAHRDIWLDNLRSRGATHLVILKSEKINTPELEFAKSMPERFRVLFEAEKAAVFEIAR